MPDENEPSNKDIILVPKPSSSAFTIDAVNDALSPSKSGENDGHLNIPDHQQEKLSDTEKNILAMADEHITNIRDYASLRKKEIHEDINAQAIPSQADDFYTVRNAPELDINKYKDECEQELVNLKAEEQEALRDLRLFRAQHKLQRSAHYPSSMINHLAFILLFLLGESIANMYFFAAGSELGFLGGFFQATLVSLANVAFSYVIGMYALTHFHHVNYLKKTVAALAFTCFSVSIFGFHLLVGHYRDLLIKDATTAANKVWEKFLSNPFGLETMESALVLMIGTVIAIIALVKGYHHDDVYPGYGKLDKNHKVKEEKYIKKSNEMKSALHNIYKKHITSIDLKVADYENRIKKMKNDLIKTEEEISSLESLKKNINPVVKASISAYRNANNKIRTEKAPPYFNDNAPDVAKNLIVDANYFQKQQIQKAISDSENTMKNIYANAKKCTQILTDQSRNVSTIIDEIIQNTDKTAKRIVAQAIASAKTSQPDNRHKHKNKDTENV